MALFDIFKGSFFVPFSDQFNKYLDEWGELLDKISNWDVTATIVPFEKQKSKRQRKIDNSTVTLAQKTEKFTKSTLQYWKKYSANYNIIHEKQEIPHSLKYRIITFESTSKRTKKV